MDDNRTFKNIFGLFGHFHKCLENKSFWKRYLPAPSKFDIPFKTLSLLDYCF
jgi:hypothetical protein